MATTNYNVGVKPRKKIILNPLQFAAIEANRIHGAKHINIEAGRGVGKSTILGWFMKEGVRQMARASGVLVGETFVQIKSRTLPSTKEGLEMFGLYEGFDYLVGRCGQKEGFEMPFQAPDAWNNVIHFRNGFIWVMVSLDDENSGRGLNSYMTIGDEAALLSHERLFNNVLTTNRAKKAEFKKSSLLNSDVFASTVALTKKGEWFTNREQLAKQKPKEYTFLKANAYINQVNLKPGWIEEMREQAVSEMLFDAEIMNIRPKGVVDGFYAQLSADKHYYKHSYKVTALDGDFTGTHKATCSIDSDLVAGQPLDLSLDFGGRINCCLVSQYFKSINTVNIIKEFFVKNPQKLSDLIKLFIDYYEPHKATCKEINLYHDRSGYKAEANSKTTLAQDVENALRAAGWRVNNKTPNTNNPPHMLKFRLVNEILEECTGALPYVRINEDNCPNLIISMENAGLNHKGDAFEKDKSSERSTVILQEHATHFSDCFDYRLWWAFSYLLDYSYHSSFIVSTL